MNIKNLKFLIKYYYYKNKLLSIMYCNYVNKLHREDGPARIIYNDGIYIEEYYLHSKEYYYEDYLKLFKKLI